MDEKDIIELGAKLHSKSDQNAEITLDVLKRLEEKHITKGVLERTKIGLAVNDCRKNSDPRVAEKAKSLLKKWKETISEKPNKEGKDAKGVKEESVKAEKPEVKAPKVPTPSNPSATGSDHVDAMYFLRDFLTSDSTRDKCAKLVLEGIFTHEGLDHEAKESVAKIASDIEREVYSVFGNTEADYKGKMRSLAFNLKDPKNPELRQGVIFGEVTPKWLSTAPVDQLASQAKKEETKKLQEKIINDTKIAASGGARTTQFRCGRCQKSDTSYSQMQTRGADEPMTTFVTCNNCGNKWKFS